MTRFQDQLVLSLELTIDGTAHKIPGGSIKAVRLDLGLTGFVGEVEFIVLDDKAHGGKFQDKLAKSFLGQDLVELSLSLGAVWDAPEASASPDPIELSALVTGRRLEELQMRERESLPVLARRYTVEFADPAQVLWTQHFPSQLYTKASLKSAIQDHLGDKIKVKFDWSELNDTKPMWFVHLPIERGASFWDFIVWYADHRGGYFAYDYKTAQYTLAGTRDTSAKPLTLFGDDLSRAELVVAEAPRHTVDVCNSYAEGAKNKTVKNAKAAKGMRHDRLMRSSISADTDDRVKLETSRLNLPKYEALVRFGRVPMSALTPGVLIKMVAANRWTKGSKLVDVTWLVRRIQLSAVAFSQPLDGDHQLDSTRFDIEMQAELQQKDDKRSSLPGYRRPDYPGFVEGKVVSTLGEDTDKTYENSKNDDTSLEEYTVKVPLWKDQEVSVPFTPLMGSANVYLPCYRDERVLLALGLDCAEIVQLLSWREGVALSKDVQGEQILWGLSADSNTSVNHVYDDDKPVFNVARTHSTDTVSIQLAEGTLMLHVEEVQE